MTASHEGKLKTALLMTGSFLIAEVVAGLLIGSLALLSDAAHMLTDVVALAIAIVAIRIGKRPSDLKRTFGYYRFEILAAAVNAILLFAVAIYILVEAYKRFQDPPDIEAGWMLAVAVGGLVVNLISMRLLREGSEESLNVKGAYLEVWSDLLGSIGVILAALAIRFLGWRQADPVLAALIGLWVLPRTWILLSQSVNILLEGVPLGIELQKLQEDLLALPGVTDIHDLHVWAITTGRNSMTVHLVTAGDSKRLLEGAQRVAKEHGIEHTSIQIEGSDGVPEGEV
ncbi:MAG: cation diffusion facilitator family transporter [Fimbriimonadaceae bacterium]